MRFLIYLGEGIKIAFEALRVYKLRSILTTLGIVIGVTTVITIVSLIQGLNSSFSEQISTLGTDTLYISKIPWLIKGDDFFRYRNRKNITMKEVEAVQKSATLVKAVAPSLATRKMVKYRDKKLERVVIEGTNENYPITSNALPEYGRFLSEIDVKHRRTVCVIGYEVAQKLFGDLDPIGRRVNISGHKFRVVGVLEKRGSLLGFNLDTFVLIPIGVFQKIFGSRRSIQIQVKVISPKLMDDAVDELTGILRKVRKVPPNKENDFAINQQSMLLNAYKSLTGGLWAVAIGVGTISLLVGGIGIMNILLVSVTERTREIGIRKAIGARRRDILWQFLLESMMICALGVAIGTIMAIGVAKLISSVSPIPSAITPLIVGLGLGFVVFIGTFFGIYPASKAAKLNPIEALRYE